MSPPRSFTDWLTLTEIGRVYGISAVHAGKLLLSAGLRQLDGRPSPEALRLGLAQRRHSSPARQTLWNREGCAPHLERQGVRPRLQRQLVDLWADLISDLQQGAPAVVMSAEDVAAELPEELLVPVNRRLRERGCSFQVSPSVRRTSHGRPGSPSPATDAIGSHRRG
ncbi:MAG: hypothetical protein VKP70_01260 [Cyanobacteriota bacterium]|nr:hypothetical protein [Cyanobacteriota bacterium]